MINVYLSSTFEDLKTHREAVCRQLQSMKDIRVKAMETYVAADDRPKDVCLKDVSESDIYVGVFAWRYGYVPTADNPGTKSITELEYREARDDGKECLIFLLDEQFAWPPGFMDSQSGENESGGRIKGLRNELKAAHTVAFFTTADSLAKVVSAAVHNSNAVRAMSAPPAAPGTGAEAIVDVRELRNSLWVGCSPADAPLGQAYAEWLTQFQKRPPLISKDGLFAQSEADFARLEADVARCEAGVLILTAAAMDQLRGNAARTARVLALARARLGALGAVLCGVPAAQLPGDWGLQPVFETADAPPTITGPLPPGLSGVSEWLQVAMPSAGARVVGLPVSVLAMDSAELEALVTAPELIGDTLGTRAQKQFLAVIQELDQAGVKWRQRFAGTRLGWRPFDPAGTTIRTIIEDIATRINAENNPRLRFRQIKVQWYPFDPLKEQIQPGATDFALRGVYQEMARAGCVLVVDNLSLFHPELRQAFLSSALFNNDQVAIVTVSPFDPAQEPMIQALETETRTQLAGLFARFAQDFDPRCELAVGDERRLKRWLHLSLPETVNHLRDPRPDPEAMRTFFAQKLGSDARRRSNEYAWGGGSAP